MHQALENLNPAQREAVRTTEGPLLVLAGAGTGKTRVITRRIAHLLSRKVPASRILALTFTNKAAGEMRERIAKLSSKDAVEELFAGTFHSFCVRVLREFGEPIGVHPKFTICDTADQLSTIKNAMRQARVAETKLQPRFALSRISLLKSADLDPERFLAQRAKDDEDELIGRVWRRYEERLEQSRSLDFDDLLGKALKLVRQEEDVRRALAERHRYLLVDEYQDTNLAQFELVRALARDHQNLCVVGDDDQSIYGWRGADVRKILDFEKHFPKAKVVKLETNYRSTNQIIKVANRIIENNPSRHAKTLHAHAGDGPPVTVLQLADETDEADFIAREILTLVNSSSGDERLGDFAVLFRTQTQPRPIEMQFRARAVPYRLVGGPSFFDRKEVRDVLAYLRLVQNPEDESALLRVVNTPPRGIGKSTVEKVSEAAAHRGVSLHRAFGDTSGLERINPASIESYHVFRGKLERLGQEPPGENLVQWIRDLLEAVDYASEVERCYPDPKEREDRWGAVTEILNAAENHVFRKKRPSLERFLSDMALATSDDESDDGPTNAVTLMTLHGAKGLEFPRVYLVGFEEGLLPHARAAEEDTVEEERRLAYVGVTRARRNLTITLTKERSKYGTRVPSMPSRFLYEMKGEPPPENWAPVGASPPPAPKGRRKAKGKAKRKTQRKTQRKAKAGAKAGAKGKVRTRGSSGTAGPARPSSGSGSS